MKTSVQSHPFCKPPLNEKLYGGRLSIARFGVSIALILITLVIALVQNGGGPNVPKSSTPDPIASGLSLP